MSHGDTTEHRIGRYLLERRIGTGGMAEVWKARISDESELARAVALKMVLPRLVSQPGFVDLFVEEARVTAQLHHANIVDVHDLGRTGDTYYLVLEYVAGTNLAQLLDSIRSRTLRLPNDIAFLIVLDMCRGLAHAHTRPTPVIHGDVSPANVLLSFDGGVKLTDFGVAQLLGNSGAPVGGKIHYMSPEQIRGHVIDVRSDVFSTGLVLYELLAERFFRGETPAEIGAQVVDYTGCPAEKLQDLQPGARAILARALEATPDQRFQSMADFETALQAVAGEVNEADVRGKLASLMRSQFRESYALDFSTGDATESETAPVPDVPPAPRAVTSDFPIPPEILQETVVSKAPPPPEPPDPPEQPALSSASERVAAPPEPVPPDRSPAQPAIPPWEQPPAAPATPEPKPARESKMPPTSGQQGEKLLERTGTPGAFRFEALDGDVLHTIIGIDLGTTFSCAASVRDGRPTIIPNELGRRTFSSAVYIHGEHVLVGEMALDHIATHPQNVIHSWKRLLGRDFNSPAVQDALDYFAYGVDAGPSGEAIVEVGDIRYRTPWLAARVLYELRVWAREELGGVVDSAVITVPAYYTGRQRDAVREAARLAGFAHVRLLAEPVAAAIAQGVRDKDKPMLVYDFGGGTFDVTVLESNGEVYEVVATGGDSYLGGVDFDDRLIKYLVAGFFEETGVNLLADPAAMARVRSAAETAKCDLSEIEETTVSLPFLAMREGEALSMNEAITRGTLEGLTDELVGRSLAACDEVLGLSGLRHDDLGEILMVGGMTRMPRIRARVQEHFKRRPRYGFADEAVALGAARFAGSLGKTGGFRVVDVVALAVGIKGGDGRFHPLIPARQSLPAEKSFTVKAQKAGQTEAKIDLFQGNAVHLSGCEYLGTVTLDEVGPAGFAGEPLAEVKLLLDEEGILRVRHGRKQLMLRAQPRVSEAMPEERERRSFWSKLLRR